MDRIKIAGKFYDLVEKPQDSPHYRRFDLLPPGGSVDGFRWCLRIATPGSLHVDACDCPGGARYSATKRPCKHITALRAYLEGK